MVLTNRRFPARAVDRYAGTSLASASYRLDTGPSWLALLLAASPGPLALFRRAVLMEHASRIASAFDVIVSVDNEMDVGRRSLQYVHFPWGFWPRPDVDIRWYHLAVLVRGYYALVHRIHKFDRARVAANTTVVNSDWTGRMFARCYDGAPSITIPPPAPARFPDVPWANRADRFVAVGRIAPEKELDKLVTIVEGVRALGHDVGLLLIGTRERRGAAGRYADRILRLARSRSSWMEVRISVPRDELARLMAGSRWGLHGMLDEHFGIAVAEMVRAGCVPFVPDGGGQVEIVGRRPELRYASAGDAVRKIDAVLRNVRLVEELRAELAARAPLYAAEAFVTSFREAVAGL